MIYLIEQIGFSEEDKSYFHIVKIGYSDDKNFKTRLNSYTAHAPCTKLLHVIPNATELQEKALHFKFEHLKYKGYGNEWFNKCDEIIDYIKSVTLEELAELPIPQKIKQQRLEVRIRKAIEISGIIAARHRFDLYKDDHLDKVANELHNLIFRKTPLLLKKLNQKQLKDINLVYQEFELTSEMIEEVRSFKDDCKNLPKEIKKVLSEFNRDKNFERRMKFLCEAALTTDQLYELFKYIPIDFQNFYIVLGPEKIKGWSYIKARLVRAYDKLNNTLTTNSNTTSEKNSLIQEKIYAKFKEGDVILVTQLKQDLKEIYELCGNKNTAVATQIGNYFEYSRTKLRIDEVTGYKPAFKLIKKLR